MAESFWDGYLERQTTLPGNKCQEDGCQGDVVRRLRGWSFPNGFQDNQPACGTCGRVYSGATNVPRAGEADSRVRIPKSFVV